MKNYCKGICKNYIVNEKIQSVIIHMDSKDVVNVKFFYVWNCYKCPCCNNILRIKPYNTTCKTRLLKEYIYM